MNSGYVMTSTTGIYWVPEENGIPSAANLVVNFGKENILSFRRLSLPRIPGLICRDCHVLVGRYEGWPRPEETKHGFFHHSEAADST